MSVTVIHNLNTDYMEMESWTDLKSGNKSVLREEAMLFRCLEDSLLRFHCSQYFQRSITLAEHVRIGINM